MRFMARVHAKSGGPGVSVVIPVRDRRQELSRCLALTRRTALAAGMRAEVIVVDDGSRDGTDRMVRATARKWRGRPDLRLVRFPSSRGPAAARNAGARAARAPYIAYLDSDCLPDRGWLGGLVRDLERTGADAVEGRTIPVEPPPYGVHDVVVVNSGEVTGFTLNLVRRDALLEAGGLDERFDRPHCREDTDFLFKLLERGRVVRGSSAVMRHPVRRAGPGRFLRETRLGVHEGLLFLKHPRLYLTRLKWIDGMAFPVYYLGWYAAACCDVLMELRGETLAGELASNSLALASLAATLYAWVRGGKKVSSWPWLVAEAVVVPFARLCWVGTGAVRAAGIAVRGDLHADVNRSLRRG